MDTKYFVVHDCSDSQKVEDFCEGSPYIEGAILFDAFIIETINLGD